jgi:hypothetical protein
VLAFYNIIETES